MSRLLEDIAERFDLPADALAGLPRITLTGDRQVLIEGRAGLLAYGPELIEAACGRLRVRVLGQELLLRAMDAQALIVAGKISAVELE